MLALKGISKFVRRAFTPGVRLVGRLSFAQKFLLIGLVMLIPLAWVGKSYLGVQSEGTTFAAKERVGIVYLKPATELLAQVVRARTLAVRAAAQRSASPRLQSAFAGARGQVEAAIGQVDAVQGASRTLGLTGQWSKLRRQIRGVVSAPVTTPAHTFADYSGLVTGIENLIADAGNNSNMILDPAGDTYYLMDSVLNHLPVEMDATGRAGDLQTIISAGGRPTLADRLSLEDLKSTTEINLSASDNNYATAFQNTQSTALKSSLSSPLKTFDNSMAAVARQLSSAARGTFNGAAASPLDTSAAAAAVSLDRATLPAIDHLLKARIDGFSAASMQTQAVALGFLLLAVYLYTCFLLGVRHEAKRAEAKFEHLLEFAPDAIVGIDRSGSIVLANAQVQKLFGYDRTVVFGRPLEMLIPERFRGGHLAHVTQFFREPKTRIMGPGLEFSGLRADRSEFPAEISISSIETEDGMIAVAAIRDITDRVHADSVRKKLEAELKLNQSRRLESIGQLAGGVAHDFNNLLSVIMNYSQFLITGLDDRPDMRDDAVQIKEASQRAADLTHQLLVFSRREVVKPDRIDLNDILRSLEKLLNRTLREGIELRTRYEPELWTVVADPGQIEQVAINLAVNARDAMADGGVLDIETSNVVLDAEFDETSPDSVAPGRYVRLTVSDTGSGMDQATASRAFEPFFTTKPRAKGTGLGLATVHGIVKQSNGNIFLYSEPGKGTSFKIHLPASDETVAATPESPSMAAPGNGERIVVVEDESAVRTLINRVLKNSNYAVIQFSNGREAMKIFEDPSERIDLLLTDVVMPDMSGREVAEQARALRPDLHVLFMSGYSEAVIDQHDAKLTTTDLIEKPFTANELLQAIRSALDGAPQQL